MTALKHDLELLPVSFDNKDLSCLALVFLSLFNLFVLLDRVVISLRLEKEVLTSVEDRSRGCQWLGPFTQTQTYSSLMTR